MMDETTIRQLNQINKAFYTRVGEPYHTSRLYTRRGWRTVLEHMRPQPAFSSGYRVLDVGCGNAQFGNFLFDHIGATLHYHGIDVNPFLLDKARENMPQQVATFSQMDLIADFESFRQLAETYHCIVLNNVLHHIPSFALRDKLLASCAEKLHAGGLLVFTLWQFLTKDKWQKRIIPWDTYPHIDAAQLEPHDYLLDWQKGTHAIRYCHFTDARELERLIHELRASHLSVVETFLADGKTNDLNRYVILQRRDELASQ